ncbi:tRNA (N6-isopentenyl adenosine(37)-C2)-methylthiotransferase MiaB [Blattabacterium cuenoti]|uniref:tRNA (N6-isopentenyl adenosine(37)-C2)-methylthiotransferase MiaB n=1 Tax=Blattabacterium cuenoti TaxID=1653831 RepID=UPI00163D0F79|nr:tRNA (N6-isopentenyl adenosine(37)-C2)-methylthiotransferase MiaB [Blattabacterium cuenoti]
MKNDKKHLANVKKTFYIKNFGCQMNTSDSEIVTSILLNNNFDLSPKIEKANIILLNSCSIREKAEITLKNKIKELKNFRKKNNIIGVIGCISKIMLKNLIKNHQIDFFSNPTYYKELPHIIQSSIKGYKIYSFPKKKETYEDVIPFKKPLPHKKKVTTIMSITRGCNNMCTFCIVPFTRGREISRNPFSIINECKNLFKNGYKEITLLGQNVDSYLWNSSHIDKSKYINFSKLLNILATEIPHMRIRFTTSNPHDMSDDVLKTISQHENICKHIHLPVQSGSNKILKLMNRKYSREEYLSLIKRIRNIIPDCSISHDIMTGFCNEEEYDHLETINLMKKVKYNYGYMFAYSPRPGTYAYKTLEDNVPYSIKKKRLSEIISLQRKHSFFRMKEYIGKIQQVLIEGESKKSPKYWYGRNTQNIVVVFLKNKFKIGDIINVKIIDITSSTLIGEDCL